MDYSAGERDMDRLGGLIRVMPWTSFFFLIGALSIAALPPFNGFVSEWLTLQTMLQSVVLHSMGIKITFALCAAALAVDRSFSRHLFCEGLRHEFSGICQIPEGL